MLGLVARLIGGAVTPLIDQASASGARRLRKLALFVVAALSMAVALVALTIAFDLWIASVKGPIAGALAVAGLYASVAGVALVFACLPGAPKKAAFKEATRGKDADKQASTARRGMEAGIDDFTAPLLGILERVGLRRERLAVLAGASLAKRMGPIPLVGLAIVAGFLIGRMWRGIFSADSLAGLFTSDLFAGLFDEKERTDGDAKPDGVENRDAA